MKRQAGMFYAFSIKLALVCMAVCHLAAESPSEAA